MAGYMLERLLQGIDETGCCGWATFGQVVFDRRIDIPAGYRPRDDRLGGHRLPRAPMRFLSRVK